MSELPTRQGELLVVPVDAWLPKICLRCGAKDDICRRPTERVIGAAGQGTALAGGGVGAVAAQSMRGMDHALAALVYAGLVVVVSIAAWFLHQRAPKVTLVVPLCARCDASWTEGEMLRRRMIAGLAVSLVPLLVGFGMHSTGLLLLGGVVFGLVVLYAAVAQIPKRFVAAMLVRPEAVSLKVAPAIADEVVERARRRAAKREVTREPDVL